MKVLILVFSGTISPVFSRQTSAPLSPKAANSALAGESLIEKHCESAKTMSPSPDLLGILVANGLPEALSVPS